MYLKYFQCCVVFDVFNLSALATPTISNLFGLFLTFFFVNYQLFEIESVVSILTFFVPLYILFGEVSLRKKELAAWNYCLVYRIWTIFIVYF